MDWCRFGPTDGERWDPAWTGLEESAVVVVRVGVWERGGSGRAYLHESAKWRGRFCWDLLSLMEMKKKKKSREMKGF